MYKLLSYTKNNLIPSELYFSKLIVILKAVINQVILITFAIFLNCCLVVINWLIFISHHSLWWYLNGLPKGSLSKIYLCLFRHSSKVLLP